MTDRLTVARFRNVHGRRRSNPEQAVHAAVLTYLRTTFPRAVIHHSPNEVDMRGPEAAKSIAKARKMGTVKGWPDIEMLHRGAFWTFEVKSEGGRTTPEQAAVGAQIIAGGGRWAVVRSIDDVAECIEEWRGDLGLDVTGAIR